MKLTGQQKEIIKVISKTTVYTEDEVLKIYEVVGSFDETIKIMRHSVFLGILPEDIISIIKDFE